MRIDKRKANQLRPVSFERQVSEFAEGSCLMKCGHTHVLCTASVKKQVPRWRKPEDGGWITAEYDMLPRANRERSNRSAGRNGRSQEISRLIGRSFRAVADLSQLPGLTITIDCDVLQGDGGTRTTAVTGGYLALVDALRHCLDLGLIEKIPLRDSVVGVSVGIVGGKALLDLCYEEDRDADVDSNFVMTGGGKLIEVQMTGEETTFTPAQLHELLALAGRGARQLTKMQRAIGDPVRFLRSRA